MNNPLVSVHMITYNHEPYIAQAIEGVLQQKTDFPIELLIGEDCSTDGTREIVFDYKKKYPDIIKVITSDKNVGAQNNSIRTRNACRGKYIALCEGDDYWTDPYKLQKQVDFLDNNPDCSMCFHSVLMVWEDGIEPSRIRKPPGSKGKYDIRDILRACFTSTCSVVYRNGLFGQFPSWYHEMPVGDNPLFVLNAMHGDIGYIDECMGVYRQHKGGIYSSKDELYKTNVALECTRIFIEVLDKKYSKLLQIRLSDYYNKLVHLYLKNGEKTKSKRYLIQSFKIRKKLLILPDFYMIKLIIRLYCPFIYKLYKKFRKETNVKGKHLTNVNVDSLVQKE